MSDWQTNQKMYNDVEILKFIGGNIIMLKFNPRCNKVKKYHGKNVWWLVLTGGPCSGKTTGEARAEIELDNKGYKVFFVDEAATRVINSGIKADIFGNYDFQTYIAKTQIVNEAMIESAIQKYVAKIETGLSIGEPIK